jgi:hypothetical protein
MSTYRYVFVMMLCVMLPACATAQAHSTGSSAEAVSTSCAITRPPEPAFVPPAPYPAQPPPGYGEAFWYGTAQLWTMLSAEGTWTGLPHESDGYSQKVFWWRAGYSGEAEPAPALTMTGRRLDATAAPLKADHPTNAEADFGQAMLIGVTIPSTGCWELTGHYGGHDLSFVVWVAP